MKLNTRRVRWLLGSVAITGVLLTTAAVYPQISSAAEDTPIEQAVPGTRGDRIDTDHAQFLADALGITVEELQAAQSEAAAAGLQQAVDEGLITQAQADQIQARGMDRGFRFGPMLGDTIDPEALLADALGISVEDLEAAQSTARDTALAQAVEEGKITQEQADRMQAHTALQPYLSERMQSAFEEAVQQAVEDDAITQEQADALLAEQADGFGPGKHMSGFGGERPGMPGRRGDHGGMPGHGMPGRGGMPGGFPNSGADDSTPQSNSTGVAVPNL